MESSYPEYEGLEIVGSGAFGYVISAYDYNNDIKVAIKRTNKVGSKLSREYDILRKINDNPYTVKLIDMFYTTNSSKDIIQNIVFEYINQSLDDYITKHKKSDKIIPIEKIKSISKELLLGLSKLHEKNIVHRDLKPENILLTEDEHVKICDFGSSKIIQKGDKSTPYIVSRYYRAPELILGKCDYDSKIDIFAAGCILAELFTLTPLFPGSSEGIQLCEYMNIVGFPGLNYFKQFEGIPKEFMESMTQMNAFHTYDLGKILNITKNNKIKYNYNDINLAVDLIYKMLNFDFEKRYTADQCLAHPFFADIY